MKHIRWKDLCYHTMGYPMPLPIVRLVLICKATEFAWNPVDVSFTTLIVMELTLDLMFTKYQADPRCLANQNKSDNGQRQRVSNPVLW